MLSGEKRKWSVALWRYNTRVKRGFTGRGVAGRHSGVFGSCRERR